MTIKQLIYTIIAIAVVLVASTVIYQTFIKDDEPIDKPKQAQTSSHSENDGESSIKKDMDKYRDKKTVSDAKTNPDLANEKQMVLNADNKVLVQTDSNNPDLVKKAMIKWNNALGENVFLPAKAGGRTDLLIQDDETKVPVNIFKSDSMDEDVDSKYKDVVVNTNDHRIMIMTQLAQGASASGDTNDYETTVREGLEKALGKSIGIEYEDNVLRDKLTSDSGKEEVKNRFQHSPSTQSEASLYNVGLTPKSKEAKYMGYKDNKTYATWTNFRENIDHLPMFKDHKSELLNVIDLPHNVLIGSDSVEQGKAINDALQSSFKSINHGEAIKSEGYYKDEHAKTDDFKTIAGTPSTMGNDFEQMSEDYSQ